MNRRYFVVGMPDNNYLPLHTACQVSTPGPLEVISWFQQPAWVLGPGVSRELAAQVLSVECAAISVDIENVPVVEKFEFEPGDQILVAVEKGSDPIGSPSDDYAFCKHIFRLLACQER